MTIDQNLFFISAASSIVGFGILGFFIFDIKQKWAALFGSAQNAGELLASLAKENKELAKTLQNHDKRLKIVEALSEISVQKVGFVRFNPFSETGGDNSFALTLLDRNNNGVIVSSLYAREGVRVYGKLVEKGAPKHPLSKEEEKSLEKALRV